MESIRGVFFVAQVIVLENFTIQSWFQEIGPTVGPFLIGTSLGDSPLAVGVPTSIFLMDWGGLVLEHSNQLINDRWKICLDNYPVEV